MCTKCGAVIEESRIVSEVQFGESSSGAAVVTGSFVAADQAHVSGQGVHGHQGESRYQTIEKTKRRMHKIAIKLDIQDHITGQAVQYFKLALSKNFVKGRRSQYVVSACLYLACRKNQTRHMLMDFAEAIYVNVYAIGATYLQLIKSLGVVNIPIVDPSLYIQKFVAQLEFDHEGSKSVMNDAIRIVQRMGKDWLHQGRRPAGIAAASLIIAMNMNNYRRSRAQIVQIAKVAEETVQRRLDEFKTTSSGTLTVQDFRNANIETEADPPSFTKHREMERRLAEQRQKLQQGESSIMPQSEEFELYEMAKEIEEFQNEMAKELEEGAKPEKIEVEAEGEVEREAKREAKREASDEAPVEPEIETEVEADSIKASSSNTENNENTASTTSREGSATPSINRRQFAKIQAMDLIRKYQEAKRQELLNANRPNSQQAWISEVRDDPDELSDVDDEELDALILTDAEAKLKSQIWMAMNRDYLIEQENKRLKMEADMKAGIYKAPRQRKPKSTSTSAANRQNTATPPGTTPSAAESAKQMVKARAFSKKINYDMLDNLFSTSKVKVDES